MKIRFVFMLYALAACSIIASAQITLPKTAPVLKVDVDGDPSHGFTVGEVKGNVGAKAVFLPKPIFPVEARYPGAEGTVRVQIGIDETGVVISTMAVSGDPLLHSSAVDAAKRSKFRIPRDKTGAAVKTSGVLIYSFVIEKAGWSRIGYGLGSLDRSPVAFFSIPMAAKAFPPEWTSEHQLLDKLREIGRTEPSAARRIADNLPIFVSIPGASRVGKSYENSVVIQQRVNIPSSPAPEQIAAAQDLIIALKARLGNDNVSLWQFNLGLELSGIFEQYRNPYTRDEASRRLTQFADNIPSGIPVETTKALRDMTATFELDNTNIDTHSEILRSINIILNSK